MSVEVSEKLKSNFIIGLLLTLCFSLMPFLKIPPLEHLEEKLYDLRFQLRGDVKPGTKIVIAAIDEKSIERLGRWPWSRNKIARLVSNLSDVGAEIIVFDVFFSEKERYDTLLENALDYSGNVLIPVVFDFEREKESPHENMLFDSAFHSITDSALYNKFRPLSAKGVLMPLPDYLENAMGIGHINMIPDRDGTLRHEATIIEYNGYLYPSIDVQTAAIYLGIPHEKMVVEATEGISLGTKRYIPTDRYGRILIHYYGSAGTFPHISIADLFDGKVKAEEVEGGIVVIGATAMGIYDLRVTPLSPIMPGVEKHANVIASILENKFIRNATVPENLALIFITGFLFALTTGRLSVRGSFLLAGLFVVSIFSLGYHALHHYGLWLNITYPLLNIIIVVTTVTAYNYAFQERYSKRIRSMFSSYVTETVLKELIKNPQMAKLGGARQEVTILFSDLKGFTSFSEKHPPEEVVPILNEYLGAMTEIIFRWEGTLDKFMGDAILAFWGAPVKQENHAELAVKCALHMVNKLNKLQETWVAEGKPVLNAGIGINTGEVLVGNIGAEGKKMDYTVIGDHVNLSSRLEALTRKYNTNILISEFTLLKIEDAIRNGTISHISTTGLEKVIVKGKEKAVGIYEVSALEHGAKSTIVGYEKSEVVRYKEK